ncbi:MAG: sensor histidine kinase [Cyclobacteriaceae bacterium]|jgi:two-component system phosphate regulon sensor histidine kinase PhoR
MKKHRHSLTLGLIISSIVLLVALQVFWIRSSYTNQVNDLRRESSAMLRGTVFQLRDSLLFSDLKPAVDSLVTRSTPGTIMFNTTKITDTVLVRKRSASVQIFLSDFQSNDSLAKAIKPFTQKLKRLQADEGNNFSIRIVADSIRVDTLQLYYARNLQEAGLRVMPRVNELNFTAWRTREWPKKLPPLAPFEHFSDMQAPPHPPRLFSDTLFTEPARLNPSHIYMATLTGVRSEVLTRIAPQLLFSAFLTSITILAFVVVFRTLREQQRLVALKDDFIRNMTHELKTPVATVSVALESLKNFNALNDPQRTQEYIAIAQGELTRLNQLTDKILKTTAVADTGHKATHEAVNLDQLAQDTAHALRLVAGKANLEIRQEKTGTQWLVAGAADQLATSLFNLLDNAIKYSPNGGTVTISLVEKGDWVELTVADQGIGIAAEFQNKIFDQFFRVPTGDVHTIKGYGLGLHYVKKVIEQHRGTIKVVSEPGRGSRFIIQLPTLRT